MTQPHPSYDIPSSPSGDDPGGDDQLNIGFERLYAGDLAGAEAAFRAAAAHESAPADAFGALGDVLSETGRAAEAAEAYARALAAEPRWTWRVARAEALAAANAPEAITEFRALAAERPDAAAVRRGLGRALAGTGWPDEAVAEYREAAFLAPGDPDTALELADLLIGNGDALAAVELLQPLLRRQGDEPALHLRIGRAWIELREPEKARVSLTRARELDPDDSLGAGASLAALEEGAADGLSDTYVRALFDRYADRFDADLVGKLGYAAPQAIRAAIGRAYGGEPEGLRVLDLGCGTGLMAPEVRGMATHLAGVDLSPRMVEKARARALYDSLAVGDIVGAMLAEPGAWDLLTAADVLVYIGDLAPVFTAAAAALRSGGRFAATVERLEGERLDGEGFALGPSRRYAHAPHYIVGTAAAAGLRVLLMDDCVPRRERQAPVPGLVFVLGRD
ncbi:tetratricopeptide repeat protein [Azospirillum sp.]|uniref:tetratricopeptide repeat protein n=1 Tax=Azospirillum sp. TaxID=34012 RepID=UPI002D438A48|nr:tetratricopeptide repeat protein [Azospirillum sp.]HYD67462.1 tetratricopeptide repeat protein [Azospirillum sp.]